MSPGSNDQPSKRPPCQKKNEVFLLFNEVLVIIFKSNKMVHVEWKEMGWTTNTFWNKTMFPSEVGGDICTVTSPQKFQKRNQPKPLHKAHPVKKRSPLKLPELSSFCVRFTASNLQYPAEWGTMSKESVCWMTMIAARQAEIVTARRTETLLQQANKLDLNFSKKRKTNLRNKTVQRSPTPSESSFSLDTQVLIVHSFHLSQQKSKLDSLSSAPQRVVL